MEASWSVPHVSRGRGPEETDGGMATNQTVLGGGPQTNNGPANGGGGPPYPAKICNLNHENITSVASELCWPPLNSETVNSLLFKIIVYLFLVRLFIDYLLSSFLRIRLDKPLTEFID